MEGTPRQVVHDLGDQTREEGIVDQSAKRSIDHQTDQTGAAVAEGSGPHVGLIVVLPHHLYDAGTDGGFDLLVPRRAHGDTVACDTFAIFAMSCCVTLIGVVPRFGAEVRIRILRSHYNTRIRIHSR